MEGQPNKYKSKNFMDGNVLPEGRRRPWPQTAKSVEQSCDPKAYLEPILPKEFHMGSVDSLLSSQGSFDMECKNALKTNMVLEKNLAEQRVEP